MTSQKGAPACWGSNEALSRVSHVRHRQAWSQRTKPCCLHAIYRRAGVTAEMACREKWLAQGVCGGVRAGAPEHFEFWRG